VLVHLGVLFALVRASPTRGKASRQEGACQLDVKSCATGQAIAGGRTDFSTVLVCADALGEFSNHILTQTGIGAGCTRLGALETGLDAFGELLLIHSPEILRVGIEHRSYVVCH
jgi:hypothetical protein